MLGRPRHEAVENFRNGYCSLMHSDGRTGTGLAMVVSLALNLDS